ncbi:hypothetical protein PSH87_14350 [Pseudomonas sp. FP453]|uniref:LPO_1073/Vpar_1526 family protein n=1 Tax=Pseudomonas sp. FP453 TaxID=2954094 RepID=UPI002735000A|nr:LPO_1073/Vpar_1526 family protein [Pseudomonas sp. FP453]WLH87873.1 hypothetical protein PSH87_14350 [Pseudomonas sp. FP453]
MLNKDQNQDAAQGALALQAGGNITIGLSAIEAIAIAREVAVATFRELSGDARDTMSARVEQITVEVISRLEKENPEGLKKAKDPDFQHALLTVQKEYGRTGDRQLGDLLVDLLVDRSKQDERNILQIVLNESLNVVPKLTDSHLANLAIVFLFRYVQSYDVVSDALLGNYLDTHVMPFVSKISKKPSSFQHLQFTGCGSEQMMAATLETLLLGSYQGLFSKGVDSSEVDAEELSWKLREVFLIRCLNDSEKFQVKFISRTALFDIFDRYYIGQEDRDKILRLFNAGLMSEDEVREKCVGLRPYLGPVFSCWNESRMTNFTLTSVGLAIGHASVKREVGSEFGDLSIWVN